LRKIISTTKINAGFLAIVLIAGTIFTISPSFMIPSAQAFLIDNKYESDYGMDNYDDKQSYGQDSNSYDKSKDSSKVKCNNINVNVNGDIDIGASQVLGALATEAQAENEGANGASSGNDGRGDGRPSGSDSDFRFVCIDNNDNTVVGEPISELCEECFAANSALQTAILDFLAESEVTISIFVSEDGIVEVILIGPETKTIEQLYTQIENAVEELGVPLSDELLKQFFTFILEGDFDAEIEELIDCLLKAGIIVDREPPSDSISDNPITTQSNNAIITQSNNPITTTTTTPIK
jgi:hypothetical protein